MTATIEIPSIIPDEDCCILFKDNLPLLKDFKPLYKKVCLKWINKKYGCVSEILPIVEFKEVKNKYDNVLVCGFKNHSNISITTIYLIREGI